MLKKKILEEFEEHPVWTKHFGKKKENYVPARLNTKLSSEAGESSIICCVRDDERRICTSLS